MVDTRTVTLPAIWADDAITEIPTPPIANTTYRNTDLGSTELLQGWPYQKIVDSADFNQTLWLISNLVKSCEQYGIMPWCASTTYKQNGICLASNGIFYWAKKDNTGVNPVNDSGMTNWGVFLDPGDNFVTETVLTSQINLCEKLANKTQTLSSSSTTTQYPSAKAVYDNIKNLQTSKQNNITGGASTITTSNLTANRALVSDGSGKVAVANVTSTELGYLDGVTSGIQSQINSKQNSSNAVTTNTDQTIAGVKTVQSNNPRFGFKHTEIDVTTNPSAEKSTRIFVSDKNNKWISEIGFYQKTDGNIVSQITANNYTAGTALLQIICKKDGSKYATCPTPPGAADSSTKIATTAWVNSRITSIMNSRSGVEQPNYATFQGLITSSSASEQSTTAPSKGWIFARMQLDNNTNRTVSVNGKEIINVRSGAEYLNGNECGACFPVNSGDTISCVRATIYFCSNY